MIGDFREYVVKVLMVNGCRFVKKNRIGVDVWFSPKSKQYFTVDGKITAGFAANSVFKSAGLEERV